MSLLVSDFQFKTLPSQAMRIKSEITGGRWTRESWTFLSAKYSICTIQTLGIVKPVHLYGVLCTHGFGGSFIYILRSFTFIYLEKQTFGSPCIDHRHFTFCPYLFPKFHHSLRGANDLSGLRNKGLLT